MIRYVKDKIRYDKWKKNGLSVVEPSNDLPYTDRASLGFKDEIIGFFVTNFGNANFDDPLEGVSLSS